MFSLRFFAPAALLLALTMLLARPAFAGPDPARAAALVEQLTSVAALLPAQLPTVRKATVRYVRALDLLAGGRFATVAAASAAYTVAEYRYYRALQRVLSPAQLAAYQHLDATHPLTAAGRP